MKGKDGPYLSSSLRFRAPASISLHTATFNGDNPCSILLKKPAPKTMAVYASPLQNVTQQECHGALFRARTKDQHDF